MHAFWLGKSSYVCIFGICVISSTLPSCQIQAQYAFSDPIIDRLSDIKVRNGTFYFPGLELYVRAWNRKGTGLLVFPILFPTDVSDNFSKPFRITIQLRSSNVGYSIDTSQTSFANLKGERSIAKGIARGSVFKGRNTPVTTIPAGGNRSFEIETDTTTIIDLEFDILPPDPDETFFLDIEGIMLSGETYPIPRIRFQKNLWSGTMH